jgi:D-xylose transport system ATP-binding protein
MEMDKQRPLLRIENVTKRFGSVTALQNVTFEMYANEVVGLVGDNGAGKSTLIKIISGNFPPDEGSMYFEGKQVHFHSPSDARQLGIETVYQDLSICDNLDSTANIFIGRELTRGLPWLGLLDSRKMTNKAADVLGKVGISLPSAGERVEYLSGGQRQAVALGRFVAWGNKLALLDEPTAAVGVRETRHVLDLIKSTKKTDIGIILISHNLQQVFEVVDRIIVLHHGEVVGIREKAKTDPDEIVSLITGSIFVQRPNNATGKETDGYQTKGEMQ